MNQPKESQCQLQATCTLSNILWDCMSTKFPSTCAERDLRPRRLFATDFGAVASMTMQLAHSFTSAMTLVVQHVDAVVQFYEHSMVSSCYFAVIVKR